uniref:Uncharacterized protein n=1 Tax=Arcella intermedia TaxID=1963864 RepID=A0A6B2LL47_9EUKA
MVVCGDGTVGKTSLLMTYSSGVFPTEYVPTVFDNWKVNVEVPINEAMISVELDIWDTAGQEDYDRLRPLSYHHSDVFLIMFSLISKESLGNVKTKWHPEVKHYAKGTPYLLVGTKSDLKETTDDAVTKEMGEEMARMIAAESYVETSAKNNINVKLMIESAVFYALSPKTQKKKRGCIIL